MPVKNRENILTVELNLESLVFFGFVCRTCFEDASVEFFFFERVTNFSV